MNKIKRWLYKHKVIIFLFLISLIIRIGVVLLIDTPIISDFKTMYEASLEVLKGTSHYKDMSYFICWGYQMGHVVYQSALLSICNSVMFLKIVNSIITSLTVVMIYLIGKEISSKKAAFIISIIYSMFLFPLLLNTVLTNQLVPILLILIALYLWIKNKKYKLSTTITIGVLLGMSNILRSETIVIIIAFILYIIFLILKKENIKKLIVSLLLIIISYVAITSSASFLLKVTNISPSGLENRNSTWKFLEGLNTETRGQYSEDDASKFAYDKKKTKKELAKRIKSEWKQYPLLFAKKTKILWLNSDLSWSLGHIENQEKLKMYEGFNQIFIYLFVLLSLLSCITLLKKSYKKEQILISLILFVYFGVYLFIEVMPRYAYSLQVFEALLATVTLGYILDNKKENKVGDHHGKNRK